MSEFFEGSESKYSMNRSYWIEVEMSSDEKPIVLTPRSPTNSAIDEEWEAVHFEEDFGYLYARRVVTGPIGSDHSHQEPAVEEAPLSGDQDTGGHQTDIPENVSALLAHRYNHDDPMSIFLAHYRKVLNFLNSALRNPGHVFVTIRAVLCLLVLIFHSSLKETGLSQRVDALEQTVTSLQAQLEQAVLNSQIAATAAAQQAQRQSPLATATHALVAASLKAQPFVEVIINALLAAGVIVMIALCQPVIERRIPPMWKTAFGYPSAVAEEVEGPEEEAEVVVSQAITINEAETVDQQEEEPIVYYELAGTSIRPPSPHPEIIDEVEDTSRQFTPRLGRGYVALTQIDPIEETASPETVINSPIRNPLNPLHLGAAEFGRHLHNGALHQPDVYETSTPRAEPEIRSSIRDPADPPRGAIGFWQDSYAPRPQMSATNVEQDRSVWVPRFLGMLDSTDLVDLHGRTVVRDGDETVDVSGILLNDDLP